MTAIISFILRIVSVIQDLKARLVETERRLDTFENVDVTELEQRVTALEQ